MNNLTITPKFGDFLLKNGQYASQDVSADQVKGIYLTDGISLVDFSSNKKMYRKADNWCLEHGGYIASAKILFFIFFNLEEINRRRQSIGQKPLPQDLLAWSTGRLQGTGYTAYNYAVNFKNATIHTLISQSMLIDDCGIACPVCVVGGTAQP